jgi:hypothetical protein
MRARWQATHELLAKLQARAEALEIDLPHVVVQTELETGCRQAVGPFPSACAAFLALDGMRAEIGEPIEFEVMPIFPPAPTG